MITSVKVKVIHQNQIGFGVAVLHLFKSINFLQQLAIPAKQVHKTQGQVGVKVP